jgi:hypothetical protein
MIMPRPARRHIDLEGDAAAQALAGGDAGGTGFGHGKLSPHRHCEERKRRSNPESSGGFSIASLRSQ